MVAVCSVLTGTALADTFDDQIAALKSQANQQQAAANSLHAQADTLQNKVNALQAQANAIQSQINLNQAKFNQVSAQIADAEAKMAKEKQILANNLKAMYLDSTVSPLEMLASSSNLSDYFNQQQYQDSIKDKIQSSLTSIETLKKQLDDQKTQIAQILQDEKGQQQQVAVLNQQAQDLLSSTRGQEAAYAQQVSSSNAKISSLKAQQWAAIAAASHSVNYGSGGSGCGGYPAGWCNAGQDTLVDSWGMFNRECVSYAAWAATARFGHYVPYWGGRGNANQWPGNARAAGIPVDGSPRVGDVAIYLGGYYGHAMIVEQVKGSTVIVSSFNGDGTGRFAYSEWSTSALLFLHFH